MLHWDCIIIYSLIPLPAGAGGRAFYYSTSLVGLEPFQSHRRPAFDSQPQVEKHACAVGSLSVVQFIVQSSADPSLVHVVSNTTEKWFQMHLCSQRHSKSSKHSHKDLLVDMRMSPTYQQT